MLLFFFIAMWCTPFRGHWDALFILGPSNLCAVSRFWGIDRAQWWTGSVSPAAIQKVNSLSMEEGKWPPGLQPAHLSRTQQLKSNCLWLGLHAYRMCQSALHVSVNSNSFIQFLHLPTDNFFGELFQASLKLETDQIKFCLRQRLESTIMCSFPFSLAFSNVSLYYFSFSANLHMCISQLKA